MESAFAAPGSLAVASDAQSILGALERHGVAVLPSVEIGGGLELARHETAVALRSEAAYEYPYGRQSRLSFAAARKRYPVLAAYLDRDAIGQALEVLGAGTQDEATDLAVWSEEWDPEASAVYGRPHFDRTHQYKVFLYLSDVSEIDGPLSVAPGSHLAGERLRLRAWRLALYESGDGVDELDQAALRAAVIELGDAFDGYSGIQCEVEPSLWASELTAIVGVAGTTVILDTNAIHCGGIVMPGGRRLVARRHVYAGE